MIQDLDFLIEKAGSLPLTPGVYIMKDQSGKVIYVGKSRALKNRVSQYFRRGTVHNKKTSFMVSNVRNFDYILTDTEEEALTLESQLIKQYDPKYNIKLKDGKRAPYIKITLNEDYPSVKVSYDRKNDGARYFGPYSSPVFAYSILKTVQKCFKVHSCNRKFPKDFGKERPCLSYHIGDCSGVCTGKISSEEYKETYKQLITFLRGSFSEVRKMLTKQMEDYSEKMMYESAALCRDRIEELSKVWQRHKIVSSPDCNDDIFALYTDDALSCLDVFHIREGRIISSEDFILTPDEILQKEDLSGFIFDYYSKHDDIPKEILVNFDLGEESESLISVLSEKAERKVTVRKAERGEKKALLDMVCENAERHVIQYRKNKGETEQTLVKLASLLGLEVVPERIESIDISNYGAENITAGLVVFVDGKKSKGDYRLFKIKDVSGTPDDYSSMCEAMRRRFERAKNGDEKFATLPDLILLDGGKGHVGAVRKTLAEMGIDIPVFGMVKDDYHKTRTLCDDENEISIAKEKDVYMLLYALQEEVHRFTIGAMRSSKTKTLKKSVLEEIDGIGSEKAKKLLAHFGGLSKLKKATEDEIAKVPGISKKNASDVAKWIKKNYTENSK